jgi:predicted ester cyclase
VQAFPDARYEPGRRSADASGNVVVEEWTVRGTHESPFMGHPPTGARVGFDAVTIYEFENGLIRRDRSYADMSKLLLGTGVLVRSGHPAGSGAG